MCWGMTPTKRRLDFSSKARRVPLYTQKPLQKSPWSATETETGCQTLRVLLLVSRARLKFAHRVLFLFFKHRHKSAGIYDSGVCIPSSVNCENKCGTNAKIARYLPICCPNVLNHEWHGSQAQFGHGRISTQAPVVLYTRTYLCARASTLSSDRSFSFPFLFIFLSFFVSLLRLQRTRRENRSEREREIDRQRKRKRKTALTPSICPRFR